MTPAEAVGPVALRRVPVGSIPRDIDRVPVERFRTGWEFMFEGRWYTVVGSPDRSGDDVRVWFQGPDVPIVDMGTFQAGARFWARPPVDPHEPAECLADGGACSNPGPFTVTDDGPLCIPHLGAHILAEAAGPVAGCDHG